MSRNRPYDSNESRRSPRERSPASQRYNDSRESGQPRGTPYRGNDTPTRPAPDSRMSSGSFSADRDNFRDGANRQIGRDFAVGLAPPRAPKGFPDAPTGPRAISFTADSRGRGGRGRARAWHDEGRERGREADYDYRDRRDDRSAPNFRGDRGREREWPDRDRRDREGINFRGRRPSSPTGIYGRGRGRGRGDWDSRTHGWSYDERDRFRGRSRSPPSRRASSVASPPPQAPEVPAFGSVVSSQPIPSGPAENGPSTAAPVSIPTGPRLQRDQTVMKSKHLQTRPVSLKYTAQTQWPQRTSTGAAQDSLPAAKPRAKSSTLLNLVKMKTSDNSSIPELVLASPDRPVLLRLPLSKTASVDEDDSDSESGEDMDDYFEAETGKVLEQLALHSSNLDERSFTYASLDKVDSHLPLKLLEIIGADDDEMDEPEPTILAPVPRPRFDMALVPDDGYLTDTEEEEVQLAAVRPMMKTPPVSSLPFAPITPWWEDADFLNDIEEAATHQLFLEQELAQKVREKGQLIHELKNEYASHYMRYLKFCDSDDPAAVNYRAKVAANQKAASRAASVTPAAEGRPEGRRAASRFATEHDIARVLQESKREAQEKQDRVERAAKAKAASEKEAIIPDMIPRDEYRAMNFADTSHLVPFDRAPAILGILPPIDDFTPDEREIFEKTYLDSPKQWSKIAAALPGRDYKNCIQHYYIVKHDDNLKEKLRKKEKGKKRGKSAGSASKPKSNALMANLGPREGETDDTQDGAEGGGERRRPRRAAAPIWPIEQPSESETATPAPTSGAGRRTTSAAKGDNTSESGPSKRKTKSNSSRDKAPKQPKNGQLLAAAPVSIPKAREEEKTQPSGQVMEKSQPKISPESSRFINQWDGPPASTNAYVTPRVPQESVGSATAPIVDKFMQGYIDREYIDSPPLGVSYDTHQQERRNMQQTSSYWSVPEQTDFPALLQHFGTDWQAIAKWMGSKTHIMVKNYYQRRIDGGNSDLEDIARAADGHRARGESTGPAPIPTVPIKRRYDGPGGALQRTTGPVMDTMEENHPASQSIMVPHAVSPPQPAISRFPALAQAGPVPQTTQPPHLTSAHAKPVHNQQQPQQWTQPVVQNRPSSGPPRGYFNSDRERPILQAAAPQHQQAPVALSDPARAQRSHLAAQEAQMERQSALKLEEQQQVRQQQNIRLKQEADMQNLGQYEQYSTAAQPSSVIARSRVGDPRMGDPSGYGPEMRRNAPPQQYVPRNIQGVREMGSDNVRSGPPTPMSNPTPQVSRVSISAPPIQQEQPSAPRQLQQPPAVTAVRQQETVRKTSSIMSLLNDEPSEPRIPPPKRGSDGPPAIPHTPPAPTSQQSIYGPTRSLSAGQSTQVRQQTSLGDMQGTAQGYPRSTGPSHGPMRVVESPYSAALQTQSQARTQMGSPLETSLNDRDPYAHQYNMPRPQQPAVSSPQLAPQYQPQRPQQPSHRQMAYGPSAKHTSSPPGQYAPLHAPKHNSFDPQYGHHAITSSVPPQMHYTPASVGSGPPVTMSYQPGQSTSQPLSAPRFPTHTAAPASQGQPQTTQQSLSQHQQPAPHAYGTMPPQSSQHHSQPPMGSRSYSPPRYEARDAYRPLQQQQQHASLDRPQLDQEELRFRQQVLQRQQRQQQEEEAYQRRYNDTRR